MRAEVTVHMDADPSEVWDLLSDVTRVGELSPETFEAEWTDGATGPAVGAHFRGHVRRNGVGPVYWTQCKVTHCEQGRDFGFTVYMGGRRLNNWRYRMVPADGGCDVTESFELEQRGVSRVYWALAGWHRRRANVRGMRQTLERARAVVEAGS
ncbi:Polyketide cyclase / dehydrase and lipid transport [Promicromonospora umidemergens]|uniref:SRPBCC family protein n=1 Tax=Promicromonospora umidemergens TaxID=629679 RepID=UPI0020A3AE2C|nr:SRPBCC family protein [Promicromonospora umidemergens]MCP2283506.1 Polyketide cyclase / dehydrase and lipid transport [Promicromonospora umidemergens]